MAELLGGAQWDFRRIKALIYDPAHVPSVTPDMSFIEINAGEQKHCEPHLKYLVSLSLGQQRETDGVLMPQWRTHLQ